LQRLQQVRFARTERNVRPTEDSETRMQGMPGAFIFHGARFYTKKKKF
jgi:hypothetical protein